LRALRLHAPGKVNLCLFLGPLREDGRHELVTLFESVSLCDELSVSVPAAEHDIVICDGVEGPNLVADALAGLRARGWDVPPLRVEITKRIPVAGGMGGGSADAAALLRIAGSLSPISAPEVASLAAELGADVPAQLEPGLVLGTGAGDVVRSVAPLVPHALVVVPLAAQLSTAEVYAEADRQGLSRGPEDLDARLVELERAVEGGARLPASLLVNDLEPAARALCPEIDDAFEAVRAADVDEVLVSGSGPTLFALCWGDDRETRAETAADRLRTRFPRTVAVAPVSSLPSGKIRTV
jgi:4-diphosphocytidyl-2-C-methyl-D-erythritol kinase